MSNADRQSRRGLKQIGSGLQDAHDPGTGSSGVQVEHFISNSSGICAKMYSKRKYYSLDNFVVSL